MRTIDKQKIRWSIESVEFHSRGLMAFTGSQVRVNRLNIYDKKGYAKADIEVSANGKSDVIKGQTYFLDGLMMWVNSLATTV